MNTNRLQELRLVVLVALACVLAVPLVVSAEAENFTSAAPETAWYDTNKSASTFYIENADQLNGLASIVNATTNDTFDGKTIILKKDIDMGTGENNTTVIGKSEEKPFKGTFDGMGYSITNVKISVTDRMYVGLFGYVFGGTIQNLSVKGEIAVTNADRPSSDDDGYECVGVIAGKIERSSTKEALIDGCTVMSGSTINVTSTSTNLALKGSRVNVGGLVGQAAKSVVVNCTSNISSITVDAEYVYAGGLAGHIWRGSPGISISNSSVNLGAMIVASNSGTKKYTGGIVGGTVKSNIWSCTSKSDICDSRNNSNKKGGIIGFLNNDEHVGEVSCCYWCDSTTDYYEGAE